jgi:DHA2 family multidrug resistance protein-like MFS transporter
MTQKIGLTSKEKRALVAVFLGVVLATLDTAIANTALPTIATDLNSTAAHSIWIINAYQLAVVSTMLPFAALGDLVGPRRVFIGGIALFVVASLACVMSNTVLLLAAARALQGIGAGAMMSVNIALVGLIYPRQQLGRGVGMNALVVALGFAIGPSVASLVLSVASWPWLFGINVPLGVLAIAFAVPTLPLRKPILREFSRITALLTVVSFAGLIFTLSSVTQLQPISVTLIALAITVLSLVTLLRREAGHAAPMLPVDLFRRPMFALSTITAIAAFATQGLAFVSLPFFFEKVLHWNPINTGFMITAWPAAVAISAPISGRLSDKYAPGLIGGIGLALLCIGMALLALLPTVPSNLSIIAYLGVCGAGFGMFQAPNLKALMSSAPPERAGGASGVIGVARLLGQASGAALVALCFHVAGMQGATLALELGAISAGIASIASFSRLWV